MSELKKQSRDPAQPGAGNADEVNRVSLARQKFRKIDILRHDCVYFSMVAATRFAASRGASCEDFSAIRRRCSGRSTRSRILCTSDSGVSSDSFKINAAPARSKISALRVW